MARDKQIVIRVSAEQLASVDKLARAEGKKRAVFVRDLLNEGWRKRYDLNPVVYGPADWQPIETAPKDGTPVILAPHMMTAWWDRGDEEWLLLHIPLDDDGKIQDDWSQPIKRFYCLYASVAASPPTHWLPAPMPPPEPPQVQP